GRARTLLRAVSGGLVGEWRTAWQDGAQRTARPAFDKVWDQLPSQLFSQDFTDERGVCFAFAELHHLSLEEVQCGILSLLKVGRRSRVRGDRLLAERFDGCAVTHLSQALSFDNAPRGFSGCEHLAKNVLSDPGADLSAVDQLDQF